MNSFKESPFLIRELIHDLMLTLTSTMIHLDSLILNMDNNSHNYLEVLQANEQMERALSFFMQLRSIYLYETNILT